MTGRLGRICRANVIDAPRCGHVCGSSADVVHVVDNGGTGDFPVNGFCSAVTTCRRVFFSRGVSTRQRVLSHYGLGSCIRPGLVCSGRQSRTRQASLLDDVPLTDKVIVDKRGVVSQNRMVGSCACQILASFSGRAGHQDSARSRLAAAVVNRTLFMLVLIVVFAFCLALFHGSCFSGPHDVAVLCTVVALFPVFISLVVGRGFFDMCVVPFTVTPVFIHIFVSSQATFVARTAVVLVYTTTIGCRCRFVVIRLISNLITVCDLHRLSGHSRVFFATLLITVDAAIMCITLRLVRSGRIFGVSHDVCACSAVGKVFLLLTCPLVCVVRGAFNFASGIALFRLSGAGGNLLHGLDRVTPNAFRRSVAMNGLTTRVTGHVRTGDLLMHAKTLCRSVNGVAGPMFFARGRTKIGPRSRLDSLRDTRVVVDRMARKLGVTRGMNLPNVVGSFVAARRNANVTGFFCMGCYGTRPARMMSGSLFRCPKPGPFAQRRTVLVVTSAMRTTSHSLGRCARRDVDGLMGGLVSKRITSKFFGRYPVAFHSVTLTGLILVSHLGTVCRAHVSCPRVGIGRGRDVGGRRRTPRTRASARGS